MARGPRLSITTTRILLLSLAIQAVVILIYAANRRVLPEDPHLAYPEVVKRNLEIQSSITMIGSGPMLARGSFWHVGWERVQGEPRVVLLDTLGRISSVLRLPNNVDVNTLTLRDVDGDGALELLYTRIWPPVTLFDSYLAAYDSVWICVRDERYGEIPFERIDLRSVGQTQVILPDEDLVGVKVDFLENKYESKGVPERLGIFVETQFFTHSRRRIFLYETDIRLEKIAEIPVPQRIDHIVWSTGDDGEPRLVLAGEFPGNGVAVSYPLVGQEPISRVVRLNDSEPMAICLGMDGSLRWKRSLRSGRFATVFPGEHGNGDVICVALRSAQDPGVALQRLDASSGETLQLAWYPNASFAYIDDEEEEFLGVVHSRDRGELLFVNNLLHENAKVRTKPALVGLQMLPAVEDRVQGTLIPVHVEGTPTTLLFNKEGEVRASVSGIVQRSWKTRNLAHSLTQFEVFSGGQLWFGKLVPNDFPLWWFWPYRWLGLLLVISNALTAAIAVMRSSWMRYRRTRIELERLKNLIARTGKQDDAASTVATLQKWIQQRRVQTHALRMYDTALQSIGLAVLNLDLRGRIRSANDRAERLLRVSNVEGKALTNFFSDGKAVDELFRVAPSRGGEELVLALKPGANGEEHAVQLTLHPLADAKNELDGWLAILDPYRATAESFQQESEQFTDLGRFGMIGLSPQMDALYREIEKIRNSDATVLIVGESGTGKEMVAEALHRHSNRSNAPYIKVNCAALSETLLESELFGHVKGSFTGAYKTRTGRFEAAAGGTILLDEIGELPSSLQVKLLRVLQEHEIERVGEQRPIKVNARILAATNQNLEQAVEEGRFRQDLYFRLNVLRLNLPRYAAGRGTSPCWPTRY